MKFQRKDRKTKIPDDSMADIAFLLIIFFMLTTTFSVNKGFDFGIPPLEEEATEDSPSRPALTLVVDTLNDPGRNYKVIVVDESGDIQEFNENSLGALYDFMLSTFETVQIEQPANWWKLPLYILIRQDAPFDGFVDVWQVVKKLEKELIPAIPESDIEKKKLATHIPHVDQVEVILDQYAAQGKLILD